MILIKAVFQSKLGNVFGRSAKDRGLKIDSGVVLYEMKYRRAKAVDSATISSVGVTDYNEFHSCVHYIEKAGVI